MSLASPKILIKFLVLKTKSWCTAQGAQLGALWWPRGVGGSRGRGCMYTERCKESDMTDTTQQQLIHYVVQQKLTL